MMISRRAFALGVVGGALVAPHAANAQPAERVYRIGCLMIRPEGSEVYREFVEGLRDLGYVEGRNLALDRRQTDGSLEHVRVLADDLVRLKVDVIVTGGDREVDAAKRATSTIPIVMAVSSSRSRDFAMKHRLPSISAERRHTEAGGLLSYGPGTSALFRRAATYVDKILKGAKPADLPIEQPAKFEMVLNLKTAKALGITMPRSLLLRADRVID